MDNIFFNEQAKTYLLGKEIIEVGSNYIVIDGGWKIYIDEQEISFLNS